MDEGVDRVAIVSDLRALRADMRAELSAVRTELSERIERLEDQVKQRSVLIAEDGATARRHFNIMVEKVEAAVKTRLEKPRTP